MQLPTLAKVRSVSESAQESAGGVSQVIPRHGSSTGASEPALPRPPAPPAVAPAAPATLAPAAPSPASPPLWPPVPPGLVFGPPSFVPSASAALGSPEAVTTRARVLHADSSTIIDGT